MDELSVRQTSLIKVRCLETPGNKFGEVQSFHGDNDISQLENKDGFDSADNKQFLLPL